MAALGSSNFTTSVRTGSTLSWVTSTNLRMTHPTTSFESTTAVTNFSKSGNYIIAQCNLTWATNSTSEDVCAMKLTNQATPATSNEHSQTTNAQISSRQSSGGKYRLTAGTSSWNSYDLDSSITKGKDVKIVYNTSNSEIKFYYWNTSVWTQIGTTQTYDIDGAGNPLYLVIHYTNTAGSDCGNFDTDNIYFDTYAADYSTQYPAPATSIKDVNGLAKANVKTFNGLAIASVKTINGLA